MKTLLTRILPLLLCILVGAVISWISFYAFWFGVWIFHTVPAARACNALGTFILWPARHLFSLLGADQSTIFADPISFSGSNGLILGILLYAIFRAALCRAPEPRPKQKY